MHSHNGQFLQILVRIVIFGFCVFLVWFLSVKIKFCVSLGVYVFMCALPGMAVTEVTYTVSGRTLNPTHSL